MTASHIPFSHQVTGLCPRDDSDEDTALSPAIGVVSGIFVSLPLWAIIVFLFMLAR
jgi:hypothetical protein